MAQASDAHDDRMARFGGGQGSVPDDVTGVLEIAGWLKESFELGPEWPGGRS